MYGQILSTSFISIIAEFPRKMRIRMSDNQSGLQTKVFKSWNVWRQLALELLPATRRHLYPENHEWVMLRYSLVFWLTCGLTFLRAIFIRETCDPRFANHPPNEWARTTAYITIYATQEQRTDLQLQSGHRRNVHSRLPCEDLVETYTVNGSVLSLHLQASRLVVELHTWDGASTGDDIDASAFARGLHISSRSTDGFAGNEKRASCDLHRGNDDYSHRIAGECNRSTESISYHNNKRGCSEEGSISCNVKNNNGHSYSYPAAENELSGKYWRSWYINVQCYLPDKFSDEYSDAFSVYPEAFGCYFDASSYFFDACSYIFDASSYIFGAYSYIFDASSYFFGAYTYIFDASSYFFDASSYFFDASSYFFDASRYKCGASRYKCGASVC